MEFIAEEEYHKSTLNRALYFYVLVLAVLLLSLNLGPYLIHDPQEIVDWMKRSILDGFISLTVKFVNFCIAKSFSSRNIAYLETEASQSIASWMFWIILTCSISSLYS